jgi:SAM-dependent methyltransferase
MMRSLLKRLLSLAAANDHAWAALDATILTVARYAESERRRKTQPPDRQAVIDEAIRTVFPELRIRHGPFRGMKYPEAKSSGSSLFPKLIGSYEREIEPILEKVCNTQYTDIVNIGCGEGYYAIGLALRIRSARVFAYDTDPEAILRCQRMAALNEVDGRLTTGFLCNSETLASLSSSGKLLIVSDCEGYEKELLSEDLVPLLARHDLLVEVHDFVDIEISDVIRQRFERSHVIEAIQSLDDIRRAKAYSYEELGRYDLATRRILLGEYRPAIMEWFYMTPRVDVSGQS